MTLNDSWNMAAEGVYAVTNRIQAYTANVANADTPYYVRKIPVIAPSDAISFQGVLENMRDNVFQTGLTANNSGVVFQGVVKDPTPGKKIYAPTHPQADKDGYVTMSNVNVVAEIADATVASKAYEANVSILAILKQMDNRAMEIGRSQG